MCEGEEKEVKDSTWFCDLGNLIIVVIIILPIIPDI